MSGSILIAGYGYFGSHLGRELEGDTFCITATTRSSPQEKQIAHPGVGFIPFDVLDLNAPAIEDEYDAIVYCIGFDRTQNADRQAVYVSGLENFLSKLKRPPKKMIYVSSTGVYGSKEGNGESDWVTEESEMNPDREGGIAVRDAENRLKSCGLPVDFTVLRFAGIYGPERIPNRAKLESGELSMQGDGYLNLIHVRDAARIVRCFLKEVNPPETYQVFNVSDGQPAKRKDFYGYLARLLDIAPPAMSDSAVSANARQGGSKKVSNQKLVRHTGYDLLYPNYRVGLESIISGSR